MMLGLPWILPIQMLGFTNPMGWIMMLEDNDVGSDQSKCDAIGILVGGIPTNPSEKYGL